MTNRRQSIMSWLVLDKVQLNVWAMTWLLAPVAIWFSYHPLIRLGQDDTMYFELSITLLFVLILTLVGLPSIWKQRSKLIRTRAVWLAGTFVVWNGLSLFWSANLVRGVLTFGVIGLLFLIFLAVLAQQKLFIKIIPALVKILLLSAVMMSVLAFLQMVAGIWLGRDETLLCAGCVAEQFGFARPNIFAIEPQFFGSLLLAPTLILLNFVLTKKLDWRRNFAFGLLVTTLFLTLSRGAIFAFILGAVILLMLRWQSWRRVLTSVSVIVPSIIAALLVQGTVAAINPNLQETFTGAVAKSVNHLSLGVIDFRAATPINTPQQDSSPETTQNQKITPNFDGYVSESTDVRVSLSKVAFQTWLADYSRTIFGVGLGASGVGMAEFSGSQNTREIVQNEFVEILLELGIIGFVIFVAIITGLFYRTRRQKWLWAIIAAFLLQWNFFSGYPNVLHIYLALIVVFILPLVQSKPAKRS